MPSNFCGLLFQIADISCNVSSFVASSGNFGDDRSRLMVAARYSCIGSSACALLVFCGAGDVLIHDWMAVMELLLSPVNAQAWLMA